MNQTTQEFENAVRKSFESWYSDNNKYLSSIKRNSSGEYIFGETDVSWNAWLACAKKLRAITEKYKNETTN